MESDRMIFESKYGNLPWKEKYHKYLTETIHWKEFRRGMFVQRNKVECENCHTTKGLQLHHNNYKCLWKETKNDITIFCNKCHRATHGIGPKSFKRTIDRPKYKKYPSTYEKVIKQFSSVGKAKTIRRKQIRLNRVITNINYILGNNYITHSLSLNQYEELERIKNTSHKYIF